MDLMKEEGISFVCGQEVGKDLSALEILEESDAMVLALGATYPRDLPIPGTVTHKAPPIIGIYLIPPPIPYIFTFTEYSLRQGASSMTPSRQNLELTKSIKASCRTCSLIVIK